MKKHFSIRVSGKVQGVSFRASTREKAEELDIKGFVQNENDGSVYIEAEGDEGAIHAFIKWCETGPSLAQVAQCVFQPGKIKGFKNFMIVHKTS
jgi:acylphosphatase